MFKLVDFLYGHQKPKRAKKQPKEPTKIPIDLSTEDKKEIRNTIKTLNRETSMILTKHLKELNLEDLAAEIDLTDLDELGNATPKKNKNKHKHLTKSKRKKKKDKEKSNKTNEDITPDDDSQDYGTFRPVATLTKSDSTSGDNFGTFRPVGTDTESSENNNFGTFRPQDLSDSKDDDDSGNYGTFCIKNINEEESQVTKKYLTASRSSTEPNSSAPDFKKMIREPEDWEKHILALEKGEFTDGMLQNGAFKRWKKERPSVPSIYLRESSDME